MSDTSTNRIIDMYLEQASAPMFLSGYFQSPPQNFHTTEYVELDIQRDDEQVAIVVKDLSLPPHSNENTLYTNKRVKPPIYDEEGSISAFDMIQRQAGQNPFANPQYLANAVRQSHTVFRKLENKVRRAIELQASQVLQTGELTLLDQNGVAVYEIDFEPKASHLANATTTWTVGGAGTRLADLSTLATIVRRDGKRTPNRLIFGSTAWDQFLAGADVQNALDSRRGVLSEVRPEPRGQGATFQGWIWIGHYKFEMWTYDGFYSHPQTGLSTPFIVGTNIIMMSEGGRLDLTYGAIPMIMPPDPRLSAFIPGRIASEGRGLDLTTNAWVTPNNKAVMVSAGTRPLTIPTAIDTFACLSTIQA